MTRTGDREIRSVSGRLPDNPGELACMRLHSTSNNVAPAHTHYMPRIHTNTCEQEINMASEMENVPESFVFSSKDPTCCDLLRAFTHIG